ncbi:hypothetical protein [Streptomyces sp. NPDC021212]|uniref:hypothetical protein n=1 Tax=Streptomyces sp. NPDC021212 TaxID=3365118 RepID=UPI0037B13B60
MTGAVAGPGHVAREGGRDRRDRLVLGLRRPGGLIADIVLFLVSEAAAGLVGAALLANGGRFIVCTCPVNRIQFEHGEGDQGDAG